jgi:TolB-like protein
MSWRSACLAVLLTTSIAGSPSARSAQDETPALLVLPIENLGRDPALGDLARAVTDLLTIALARSSHCAVVERERLAALLAEQSLSAAGLAEPGTRRTIGKLLGARWMLHGSLARRGARLWLAAHVTELESTRVLASEQIEAEPAELAPRLGELAAKLTRALGARPGGVAPEELDPTPVANLHFLRGLGHFYSGEHHRALAEFLRAGAEPELADSAGLWRASCYLALGEHAHAYLELARLQRGGAASLDPRELEERLARCRSELSPDELRTCEALALARGR